MLEALHEYFHNPYEVREALHEYNRIMMKPEDSFLDFRSRFVQLATLAQIPMLSRRMDLYEKLTVDLQESILSQLDNLTTYSLLEKKVQGLYDLRQRVNERKKRITQPRKVGGDLKEIEGGSDRSASEGEDQGKEYA